MSSHHRFTEAMTFLIDTDKKTITIKGSYKFEDLKEAMNGILKQYPEYTLQSSEPDLSDLEGLIQEPFDV